MPNGMRDARVMVPQLPPRHIARPRLLAGLEAAAHLPLTLLSAGPGTGKTVLLTDWAERADTRVAWLTPTPADAEPRRQALLFQALLRAERMLCEQSGEIVTPADYHARFPEFASPGADPAASSAPTRDRPRRAPIRSSGAACLRRESPWDEPG